MVCSVYHNYNTCSTHKIARFDSKMYGSTQKSPVQHKNARFDTKMPSPACISWHCRYQTPPFMCEIFCFQFYSNILFLRTNTEMKMKLYWYEFKIIYIQHHYENWNIIILFCLWWPKCLQLWINATCMAEYPANFCIFFWLIHQNMTPT